MHYTPHRVSTRNSSSSITRSSTPEQQQTSDTQGTVALNEDMLSQLRAAQEEAARLKQELAQLQQKASDEPMHTLLCRLRNWQQLQYAWRLACNQAPPAVHAANT
jgi:hypothetical protein